VGLTREFKPEEIGRIAQIEETAMAVTLAMREAGIASPADVHFVQIKCPLLTKDRIEEAARRSWKTAPGGAGGRDWSLYSGVASTSAGVELLRNEIVVLGNAPGWGGNLVIDHAVM